MKYVRTPKALEDAKKRFNKNRKKSTTAWLHPNEICYIYKKEYVKLEDKFKECSNENQKLKEAIGKCIDEVNINGDVDTALSYLNAAL